MLLYISCPAVSQINRFMHPSPGISLNIFWKLKPMVFYALSDSKVSYVARTIIEVLPTPESPIKITFNRMLILITLHLFIMTQNMGRNKKGENRSLCISLCTHCILIQLCYAFLFLTATMLYLLRSPFCFSQCTTRNCFDTTRLKFYGLKTMYVDL